MKEQALADPGRNSKTVICTVHVKCEILCEKLVL